MAASVRLEDEAFSDVRFEVLAALCRLADADHARGKIAKLWRQCTAQGTYVLSEAMVRAVLGPDGPDALCQAELGERVDGGIRMKGTVGRIEWLEKLRENSRKGGEARRSQEEARRKPRGSQEARHSKPDGSQNEAKTEPLPSPPDPSSAPAAAPDPDHALSYAREDVVPLGERDRRQRLIVANVGPAHAKAYAALRSELGSTAIGPSVVGDFAELRALLDSMPSLDDAEERCMHAIAVREAEARSTKSLKYFGNNMWKRAAFEKALAMEVDDVKKPARGGRVEPMTPEQYAKEKSPW